jgi:predicted nucleic acid-binding protein
VSTLVDTNVLLDLLDQDEEWIDWSAAMLSRAAREGPLIINPLIYAETSVTFNSLEELDAALPSEYFVREPLPWEAAFLAGKAFTAYRRRGGRRPAILTDFYIGAHAAVAGHTLLTRDPGRYRSSFPRLRILAP